MLANEGGFAPRTFHRRLAVGRHGRLLALYDQDRIP